MLADDSASRSVWTGPDGALAGLRDGAVAIECSTLSPAWVTELAELVDARGAAFLDAPVTGSKPQAASREVLFLVGGDPEALASVRDVLRPMSRDAVHMGPVGSGAKMKLVNNFMSAVQAVALGEALAFSEKCGLDPVGAMHVLANGAPGSPLVKTVGARMLARDYSVNFFLRLMRKDISYASRKRGGTESSCAPRPRRWRLSTAPSRPAGATPISPRSPRRSPEGSPRQAYRPPTDRIAHDRPSFGSPHRPCRSRHPRAADRGDRRCSAPSGGLLW